MKRAHWFIVVAAVVAGVNVGFTALAMSFPVHEEWLFYMDMPIPSEIASNNSESDVTPRLVAAGYNVTETAHGNDVGLVVTWPAEPDYQAWLADLGEPDGGWVTVDIKCRTGCFHSDCPQPTGEHLRDHLAQLLEDAGLPLDAAGAHYGDYAEERGAGGSPRVRVGHKTIQTGLHIRTAIRRLMANMLEPALPHSLHPPQGF